MGYIRNNYSFLWVLRYATELFVKSKIFKDLVNTILNNINLDNAWIEKLAIWHNGYKQGIHKRERKRVHPLTCYTLIWWNFRMSEDEKKETEKLWTSESSGK